MFEFCNGRFPHVVFRCPPIYGAAAWKREQAAAERKEAAVGNEKRNKIIWEKMEAGDFELEKILMIMWDSGNSLLWFWILFKFYLFCFSFSDEKYYRMKRAQEPDEE